MKEQRQAVFTTFLTCAKLFHYVVTGRLPCRPLRGQRAFVSLPNRDDSRVDRNLPNKPNRSVGGRLPCRTRHSHYVVFQFFALHPTTTGVDGEQVTRKSARTVDLYTPVWLGCQAFPTGEHPVTR
ncbi:hypothetical protein [Spirosoma terrae]|uniref:Uncharacterized protein n=1 Tax=Spirosoma terrae TaxID=1968276 RepID=A0A6L9LCF4_9BACT|nr:hypothetical protein [Spirosoma terrae]NDU98245.1 hypothetical protein [Spirosoma terrae]